MSNKKKRILLVNEFSKLATGFSVMGYETLSRLKKTNKYEIAELAAYINEDDYRINEIPWKVYPAQPSPKDKDRTNKYFSNYKENQFGAMVFDDTVLNFRPDIVFSFRDIWHDSFITRSPYRQYFYYIWSSCVDSEPPKIEWLDLYSTVDLVTSYSKWGLNVLKKYGGNGLINIANTDTMPGVSLDIFKPMDRNKIRAKYGIRPDFFDSKDGVFIIMKCARNQVRKLYPDLIRSFMNTIDKLYKNGKDDIANRTYLYLHTSLTDVGWDILREIRNYHASHKILLTYICHNCKNIFISFPRGKCCHCTKCGQLLAITPNTNIGVDREILAELYNIANIYVQVQIAGALEIPLLEAKACGIPTLSVEYAAPFEIQQTPGSLGTVKIANYRQESILETEQLRGYVDEEDLIKKLYKSINIDPEKYRNLCLQSRETAEKYHSFDLTVEKWMSLFDNINDFNKDRWTQKPQILQINPQQIPIQLPNNQFVRWCAREWLPSSHPDSTFLTEKKNLEALNNGFEITSEGQKPFTKKDLVNRLLKEIDRLNHFEAHRYNKLILQPKKTKEDVEFKIF